MSDKILSMDTLGSILTPLIPSERVRVEQHDEAQCKKLEDAERGNAVVDAARVLRHSLACDNDPALSRAYDQLWCTLDTLDKAKGE